MVEKKTLLSGAVFAFVVVSTLAPLAAAQTYPPNPTNQMTLEDTLKVARERIKEVQQHPGAGSGTPYLDANGVVGASIISGAVFGGIFVAFVVRARKAETYLAKMG